jgi:hypothetical protein
LALGAKPWIAAAYGLAMTGLDLMDCFAALAMMGLDFMDCFAVLAMTGLPQMTSPQGRWPMPCHREERSDAAIHWCRLGRQLWIASLRSQ